MSKFNVRWLDDASSALPMEGYRAIQGILAQAKEEIERLQGEVERLEYGVEAQQDSANKDKQEANELQSELAAVEKERDEANEIIDLGEEGHLGPDVQIRMRIGKLEAERLQQAIDWDELDDEFQKIKAENAELNKEIVKLNERVEELREIGKHVHVAMPDSPLCAECDRDLRHEIHLRTNE